MAQSEINIRDVGRTPQDCAKKSGIEGVATIIGFWMFNNARRGEFFGSVGTAVRQVWYQRDEEHPASITQSTSSLVARRLKDNGFSFEKDATDRPRWRVPATWRWDHPEERPLAAVPDEPTPEPGPVRTSWTCKDHPDLRFGRKAELLGHYSRAHRARYGPGELQEAVERALPSDGSFVSSESLAEALGIATANVAGALGRLKKKGKVRLQREQRWQGGTAWGRVPRGAKSSKKPPKSQSRRVVLDEEEPEKAAKPTVIMRPDGSLWRVVRALPGGAMELEAIT